MATSGVGMLAQVLGSTLDANRRNAMWQAEQEQQNEQADAARQAAQQNLATQLKAHLMSQLIADANKNVSMAQAEDRWNRRQDDLMTRQDAREKAIAERSAAAIQRQKDADDARYKQAMDLEEARAKHALELKGTKAPPTTRYTISQRTGEGWSTGRGGQQPDVRKSYEYNAMRAADAALAEATRTWIQTMEGMKGVPTPQLIQARNRAEAAQQLFDNAYPGERRKMMQAPSTSTAQGGTPEMDDRL
jgi:hypothetical protein